MVVHYTAEIMHRSAGKHALDCRAVCVISAVFTINNRLGGLSFYEDSNGKWVVGADSVPKKLGSGLETIIDVCHCTRYKDIGVASDTAGNKKYGSVAEYDLTAIPDYQNLIFGENIIANCAIVKAAQTIDQLIYIVQEDQINVDSFDYKTVKVTDFWDLIKQDVSNWNQNEKPYNWRQNFVRYVPSIGKLYVISVQSTATITAIGLYKI